MMPDCVHLMVCLHMWTFKFISQQVLKQYSNGAQYGCLVSSTVLVFVHELCLLHYASYVDRQIPMKQYNLRRWNKKYLKFLLSCMFAENVKHSRRLDFSCKCKAETRKGWSCEAWFMFLLVYQASV